MVSPGGYLEKSPTLAPNSGVLWEKLPRLHVVRPTQFTPVGAVFACHLQSNDAFADEAATRSTSTP